MIVDNNSIGKWEEANFINNEVIVYLDANWEMCVHDKSHLNLGYQYKNNKKRTNDVHKFC